MTYLLFMDESGHDHKNAPYEVHGGIALPLESLWPFIQQVRDYEREAFGAELHTFPPDKKGRSKEIKGAKLLDKDRFLWAAQEDTLPATTRRALASRFLHGSASPSRDEFTAYGQACLHLVHRIFETLAKYNALTFAIAVPREAPKPPPDLKNEFLRRDYVYLLERYGYLLEERDARGLLIMDRIEDKSDSRLTRSIMNHFTNTAKGRQRAQRIVPYPFFVSSDITSLVQVADVVIYCINWGYRIPNRGMTEATRPEMESHFAEPIRRLLWSGKGRGEDGQEFSTYSIHYVADLYGSSAP